MEKPGIEPATPGLQGIALIHYTTGASLKNKTFCGFSMGRNQYWAGRVYDLCVYYMTGTPEGSTESGFMEKPGIEPATPGLQGIALIHYTTKKTFCGFPWVETSTAGRVYDLCVYYMTGAPEGSPKVVLCGFMVFYGEAGNRTCDPWFTRHSAYPLHHGGFSKKNFLWLSLCRNQYRREGL